MLLGPSGAWGSKFGLPSALTWVDSMWGGMSCSSGPVLSPFASWMPVLAGKSPSLHAMAVWDCNHRDGPFFHDRWNIEKEIRAGRWAGLLVGTQPFMRAVGNHYRLEEDLFEDGDDALMPKTGWRARPEALWVPRESEW